MNLECDAGVAASKKATGPASCSGTGSGFVTRKLTRWLLLGLGATLALLLLLMAFLLWRLQQGPLRLPLLEPYVRAALEHSLRDTSVQVTFRDVVLEIDRMRKLPSLRMRDLRLRDRRNGRELATAPRASLAMAGADLLRGKVRARHLELAGVHLIIRRDTAGNWHAGIEQPDTANASQSEKYSNAKHAAGLEKNANPDLPASGNISLGSLLNLLRAESGKPAGMGQLGSLESLRISSAFVEFRDAVLGMTWQAPNADLLLRRVPYGYAMLAKARISEKQGKPVFSVVLNASWNRQSSRLNGSIQMEEAELGNLLQGFLGKQLQIGGVRLPFSARGSFSLDAAGTSSSASVELLFSKGQVEVPGWLARPLVVREGLLRLDYQPRTAEIIVRKGEVLLAEGKTHLQGRLQLLDADSWLPRLGLDLAVSHVPDKKREQTTLKKLILKGKAQLAPLRLDIDDLQLYGDSGAIRVRGRVQQEQEGTGLYVSAVGRNISHRMLKALWPPKIGIGARQWVRENVVAGVIPSISARLAIPGRVLKAAVVDDVPMPDDVAEVRFTVSDVRFSYIDGWPLVEAAAGGGRMSGNHFRMTLTKGYSRLKSGQVLKLVKGELRSRDLAAKVSPGQIDVQASGAAQAFQELIDSPPLRLRQRIGVTKGNVKGRVMLNARLKLPFHRGMRGEDITVERVAVKIRQADAIGMVKSMDLRRGDFDLEYRQGLLKVSGKAWLNGEFPARLFWQRPLEEAAKKHKPMLRLQLRLSDAQRRKLGVDLSPWLTGAVQVQVEAPGDSWRIDRFHVRLGLDEMAMNLPAIGWQRPARKGTKAVLDVRLNEKDIRISKLRLTGPGGLRVEGKLRLHPDGRFRDATFARFELDADNRLALGLALEGDRLNVVAAGPVFDARPLIRRLFAPKRQIDRTLRSVFVRVNLRRVLALRGEAISDVRGEVEMRDGLVQRALLRGRFASGRNITLDLRPAPNGLRRLRITSDDAGAVLRASGLYSRIMGGEVDFTALLKGGDDGGVQRGLLIMRRFAVRGDQRLARLQQNERKKRTGPRKGTRFSKLVLPFSTDKRFIRIGDAIINSPEIGATANGMIRRVDGAMDIGGTIIPAYALNAAFGKIPVLGMLLTGGRGQGVFGMNYALKGTMDKPKFLVNPLSAVAPGVFRQLFHLGGQNVNPDGTARKRGGRKTRPRRTNLANGARR